MSHIFLYVLLSKLNAIYCDPIYSRQIIHKPSSQPVAKDGALDHGMIACLWKLLGVSSLQIFSLVFIIYEPYIFSID